MEGPLFAHPPRHRGAAASFAPSRLGTWPAACGPSPGSAARRHPGAQFPLPYHEDVTSLQGYVRCAHTVQGPFIKPKMGAKMAHLQQVC